MFYCIFDQIYAAVVSYRRVLQSLEETKSTVFLN